MMKRTLTLFGQVKKSSLFTKNSPFIKQAHLPIKASSQTFANRQQRYFSSSVKKETALINATVEEQLSHAAQHGRQDVIAQLIEQLPSTENKKKLPLLLEALECYQFETANYLIEKKYGTQARNAENDTTLHVAIRQGYSELINKILDSGGATINDINQKGETALHIAVWQNDKHSLEKLLNKGIDKEKLAKFQFGNMLTLKLSALHLAILKGHEELAAILLKNKACLTNVNVPGVDNILQLAIFTNQLHVLGYLLQHERIGPTLKQNQELLQSALSFAISYGKKDAIKLLVRNGAGLNISDANGKYPLLHAIEKCKPEIVKLLTELGADPEIHDSDSKSVITYAEELQKNAVNSLKQSDYEEISNLLKTAIQFKKYRKYTPPDFTLLQVENLVFQGGGPKGIAYTGALTALNEELKQQEPERSMQDLKRIAGTSAGAITAALLAVGYTPEELKNILNKTNIAEFLDHEAAKNLSNLLEDSSVKNVLLNFFDMCKGYFSDDINQQTKTPTRLIRELLKTQGLCKGEKFRNWIDEHIKEKLGKSNATMADLAAQVGRYQSSFRHLYISAIDIKSLKVTTFNSEDEKWKDIIIADAVRCSMSIPGVFKPCPLYEWKNGKRKSYDENINYIDGGLIYNYPIDIFDKIKYIEQGLRSEQQDYPFFNERTLGFSLFTAEVIQKTTPQEARSWIQSLRDAISSTDFAKDTKKTQEFISNVVKVYLYAERLTLERRGYDKHRTVYINNKGVNLLDFNLNETKKQELIESGKEAVKTFYEKQRKKNESFWNGSNINDKNKNQEKESTLNNKEKQSASQNSNSTVPDFEKKSPSP